MATANQSARTACLVGLLAALAALTACGGEGAIQGTSGTPDDAAGTDAVLLDDSEVEVDVVAGPDVAATGDGVAGDTVAGDAVLTDALLDGMKGADALEDALLDVPEDAAVEVAQEVMPADTTDAGTPQDAVVGPAKCQSDKDCSGAGQVCDPLKKVCVACLTDLNCAANQHCVAYICESATACVNSLSCVGVMNADGSAQPICDQTAGTCTACLASDDCPANSDCSAKKCVPFKPCQNSNDCGVDQVCDPMSNRCTQCLTTSDCGANTLCEAGTCKPFVACVSDKQCTPLGMLCDTSKGKCGQCLQNKDCPSVYNCQKVGVSGTGECVLDACIAGQGACVGGQKVFCDASGDSFGSPEACPEKTTCVAPGGQPACKPWLCQPGVNCDTDKLVHCSDDGLTVIDTTDCTVSAQKCSSGTCKPALCKPATLYCDAATLKTCSPDGFSVVAAQPCGAGTYCGLGKLGDAGCQPIVCEPGKALCDGTKPATCNADGSALIDGAADCQSLGKWCVGGACVASCQSGAPPSSWYMDSDGDGYGVLGSSVAACQPNGLYTSLTPTDCDDANAAVHPGQTETCGDSIDNDCNGKTAPIADLDDALDAAA